MRLGSSAVAGETNSRNSVRQAAPKTATGEATISARALEDYRVDAIRRSHHPEL